MTQTYIIDVRNLMEEAVFEKFYSQMSAYRRKKIDKYKKNEDKCRSLGVGILTDIYLKSKGLRESDMVYGERKNGKPYFENAAGIYFNASHSGNYAVCSFSDRQVGCDIETTCQKNLKVAQRYFTDAEKEYIFNSLTSGNCHCEKNIIHSDMSCMEEKSDYDELQRFVRLWTIKESYLKWLGCGLTKSLNSFEISIEKNGKIHIFDNDTCCLDDYMKKEESESFKEDKGNNEAGCFLKEYSAGNCIISVCCENENFEGELKWVMV